MVLMNKEWQRTIRRIKRVALALSHCSHVLEQWKVLIIIGIVIIIFISPVVDGVDELRKATDDKTAQEDDSRF